MASPPADVRLRGDRFAPLHWDRMSPEQQQVVASLLRGPRAALDGPFNALLRSPDMADCAQRLGEYVRFRSTVPPRLNEMVILLTARWWSAQFEWHVHKALALEAGLAASIIDDIHAGKRPSAMQPDEAAVFDFAMELRTRRRVSDTTFNAAVSALGEQGVVDLVGTMGYYDLVSMVLNVDRYPLPSGVVSPFAEPE